MITVNGLKDKDWDEFITRHSQDGGFLQSWAWGEFQKSLGRKIWRLAVVDEGFKGGLSEIKAVMLLIKQPLKYGFFYFYSPRGPVAKTLDDNSLKEILKQIDGAVSKLAKQEKAIFWRTEPGWPTKTVTPYFFSEAGFLKSVDDTQPRHTLILNLLQPAEEILKKMKPKTRYNIGLAERHGVMIRHGQTLEDLKIFYRLMEKTTARQEFRTHSFQYFEKMWLTLAPAGYLKLFLAEYKGEVVGVILVSFFGDTAIYLHGGMSDQQREVMAPFLLQWTAIKEARTSGFKKYDFWGVTPQEPVQRTAKEKNWEGITRFKRGFVPDTDTTEYVGSFEKPYKSLIYAVYRLLKNR